MIISREKRLKKLNTHYNKVETVENFPNIIKNIYKKCTAGITFYGKRLQVFPETGKNKDEHGCRLCLTFYWRV